jgi:hypothetical protein
MRNDKGNEIKSILEKIKGKQVEDYEIADLVSVFCIQYCAGTLPEYENEIRRLASLYNEWLTSASVRLYSNMEIARNAVVCGCDKLKGL